MVHQIATIIRICNLLAIFSKKLWRIWLGHEVFSSFTRSPVPFLQSCSRRRLHHGLKCRCVYYCQPQKYLLRTHKICILCPSHAPIMPVHLWLNVPVWLVDELNLLRVLVEPVGHVVDVQLVILQVQSRVRPPPSHLICVCEYTLSGKTSRTLLLQK